MLLQFIKAEQIAVVFYILRIICYNYNRFLHRL